MNKASLKLMTEFVGWGGLRTFTRRLAQPLIIFLSGSKNRVASME
jgi:hypothetical protein